jgi:molybdopterin converting factor small subunit
VEGATVGEVLVHARATYGQHFADVLDHARVWLNGDEPTDGDATPVADGDEVAVLPPVSGG